MRAQHVLLGVTGGIAAYKIPTLVRRLREGGLEVQCALSGHAGRFVTPLTLEVLSGRGVYGEEYLEAIGTGEELHVSAAEWADVFCIAPATAHVLSRLALGLGDDFLTTTALVWEGPLVVAPAMHSAMWLKASTQSHIDTLRARGVVVVGPEEGPLASGATGIGRMSEPETLAAAISALAQPGSLAARRVLVSAGPTQEPIDPVRYLGNRSSGKMGFAIAAEAARRGATVTLVAGPVSLPTPRGVKRRDVTTANQMQAAVYEAAADCDLIVLTAAVADFRPVRTEDQKIKRSGSALLELTLEENPDILAGLAEVAPKAFRVGFAAETEGMESEARRKLERKGVDLMVANDVSRADIGFGSDDNELVLYPREGAPVTLTKKPKTELAAELLDFVSKAMTARLAAGSGPP